jgi:hypothetical protein
MALPSTPKSAIPVDFARKTAVARIEAVCVKKARFMFMDSSHSGAIVVSQEGHGEIQTNLERNQPSLAYISAGGSTRCEEILEGRMLVKSWKAMYSRP